MRALKWAVGVAVAIGLTFGGTFSASGTYSSALAQPPGRQTDGMITSVDGNVITLMNGASFPINDATRVARISYGSFGDLQPGKYISLSARPGAGGMLEAFVVGIFAEGVTPNEGQRDLTEFRFCQPGCAERDTMTNAAINDARLDAVTSGELAISFAGQQGTVLLSPATRVELQNPGTLADIVSGANVLGFLNDEGVAGLVWVYMD